MAVNINKLVTGSMSLRTNESGGSIFYTYQGTLESDMPVPGEDNILLCQFPIQDLIASDNSELPSTLTLDPTKIQGTFSVTGGNPSSGTFPQAVPEEMGPGLAFPIILQNDENNEMSFYALFNDGNGYVWINTETGETYSTITIPVNEYSSIRPAFTSSESQETFSVNITFGT